MTSPAWNKKRDRSRRVTWAVKRRAEGWVAVVYVGEDPITFGPPTDRVAARAFARERAAEFRINAGK